MMNVLQWAAVRVVGRRLVPVLATLAALLLLCAGFFAFVLPQSPGRMADPSAALVSGQPLWTWVQALPVPRTGAAVALAVLAVSGARFALYALAVFICWHASTSRATFAVAIAAALLMFWLAAWALPTADRDIYNYILSGRVAAVYQSNPYYVAPDHFPSDPLYRYASQRYTSIAGDNKFPVWALLNAGLAALGGHAPVPNLLLYRAVFLLFSSANLGLIALILRVVRPRRMLVGVVLYGWNPITVTYGQSKVDTIMVCLLLLGALALVYRRRHLAAAALVGSAWVKLIALPLLPMLLLRDARQRRWHGLAAGLAVASLVTLAVYAPFWRSTELLLRQAELLRSSSGARPALVQGLVQAVFAGALLWAGYTCEPGALPMFRRWAFVVLLFALVLTRLGFSWYLLTLVALASIAVEWHLVVATVALSCASFLINVWDSASNEVLRLPNLFAVPRPIVYIVFVLALGVSVAAMQWGQRGLPVFRRERGQPVETR